MARADVIKFTCDKCGTAIEEPAQLSGARDLPNGWATVRIYWIPRERSIPERHADAELCGVCSQATKEFVTGR